LKHNLANQLSIGAAIAYDRRSLAHLRFTHITADQPFDRFEIEAEILWSILFERQAIIQTVLQNW
jgi:hypothetical protein